MRDEELARDARAGSCRAFEALVVRYEARLFRFARRFGLTVEEAEDATQDALLGAWRSLGRYDPGRPFAPWLFTILARRAGSIGRARESRLRLIGRIREREQEPPDDRSPRAAGDAEGLWKIALRELGPQASSALWLRYVEDMSPGQIALVLGKSGGAVRIMLHRARRQLLECLPEETIERLGGGQQCADTGRARYAECGT